MNNRPSASAEERQYTGLLFIGDPHLEGRVPGFRCDDYPRVILEKFRWSLEYARANRLLPVVLGDLFDKPRDNPTWMLGELIVMLSGIECVGIYGNHDCAEPQLTDDDSLSLLVKSKGLRLLDDNPWSGQMGGRTVVVGGSSYRRDIPRAFHSSVVASRDSPLVLWVTHHDIKVPGYEEQGRYAPRELAGIDLVINGHIHRVLEDVQFGRTVWITPGNIARRSRSDAAAQHTPALLRIDVRSNGFTRTMVEVPHSPAADVFHPAIADAFDHADDGGSRFITGLCQLQSLRTADGSGLREFLEKNLAQFEQSVQDAVTDLAKEIAP